MDEVAASNGSSQLRGKGNADAGTATDAALAVSNDELRQAGALA